MILTRATAHIRPNLPVILSAAIGSLRRPIAKSKEFQYPSAPSAQPAQAIYRSHKVSIKQTCHRRSLGDINTAITSRQAAHPALRVSKLYIVVTHYGWRDAKLGAKPRRAAARKEKSDARCCLATRSRMAWLCECCKTVLSKRQRRVLL